MRIRHGQLAAAQTALADVEKREEAMQTKLNRRSVLAASAAGGAALAFAGATPAISQSTRKLRIQTHLAEPSIEGQGYAKFANLCGLFSGGNLEIEMHFSSDIVKETEAFEATRTGIIDGDCTSPTFITGKEPAFQFFGDLLGGYRNPAQIQAWFHAGGGREIGTELYSGFDCHLVGLFFSGVEALSSTKPLTGIKDLVEWRFRCPPGMETEIFTALGAKPVVMPFAEVFTALSTGVVDGADASMLSLNKQLGLYDIAKHATFPGFHSMPSNHLNISKRVWDSLSSEHQQIIEAAYNFAMQGAVLQYIAADARVAGELRAAGVTLHQWSDDDVKTYSAASRGAWSDWSGRGALAKKAVDSHIAFLTSLGLID
ncbi:MAG: TRAP transporter substrate-binding protein DctP [Rhizobiaceae bacterium]